jgi:NADH-quinone oxidoreductase subunit H
VKVLACLLLMIWTRATLPRIRYDRLMALGWKVLTPVAIANVIVTALLIVLGVPGFGS